MDRKAPPLSHAKALLMQWLALWQAAFLFGKSMTLAQYRDPVRAANKAEMLEVWTRFALFTLLDQIAALEPQSKEDERDIARLRAIVGAPAGLCLLATKVKRQCIGLVGCSERREVHQFDGALRSGAAEAHCTLPGTARGYFDSG